MTKFKLNSIYSIIILLIIILSIAYPTENSIESKNQKSTENSNTPNCSALETLDYLEYWYYNNIGLDHYDKIYWFMHSSNSLVGITVMAMDDINFAEFESSDPFYYYSLSDGDYIEDSGTWRPPSADTWYMIWFNNDTNMQSALVLCYFEISYDAYAAASSDDNDATSSDDDDDNEQELNLVLIVIIGIIGVVAAGSVIIYVVIKKSKTKERIITPTPLSAPSSQIESQLPKTDLEFRFCSECGSKEQKDSMYCSICGNKLY